MVSQYQEFLKEKDAQLQQMETLRLKLTQELIEKQTAIDSLQHRPIPKPRTHVVDPQQIAELKQQLGEARQQLQREKNYRETSEQRNRDLRSKLEKTTEESIASNSRLQTAESENAQLRRERKTVSD